MDDDQTNLLAAGHQVIDRFLGRLTGGTHADDHPFRFGIAVVVERMVLASRQIGNLFHVLRDRLGQLIVKTVAGFARLEENVRILRGPLGVRMLGIQRVGLELGNRVIIDQLRQIVVVQHLDLLDLVRSAEAVEKVQERHARLDGRQMRNGGQIHGFLYAGGSQHRKSCAATGHHVAMVAKDREGMRRQGTGADVENGRQAFAGDFIHIGDHQQQSLRSRKSRRQGSGAQRTVHSA